MSKCNRTETLRRGTLHSPDSSPRTPLTRYKVHRCWLCNWILSWRVLCSIWLSGQEFPGPDSGSPAGNHHWRLRLENPATMVWGNLCLWREAAYSTNWKPSSVFSTASFFPVGEHLEAGFNTYHLMSKIEIIFVNLNICLLATVHSAQGIVGFSGT